MQSPRPEHGSFMPGPMHWPVTRAEELAEQLQKVLSLKEEGEMDLAWGTVRWIRCQTTFALWPKLTDQCVNLTSRRSTRTSHKRVCRCHGTWQRFQRLSANEMLRLLWHGPFNVCRPLLTVWIPSHSHTLDTKHEHWRWRLCWKSWVWLLLFPFFQMERFYKRSGRQSFSELWASFWNFPKRETHLRY